MAYNYKVGGIVTLCEKMFATEALQNAIYKITYVGSAAVRLTPVNPAISQLMYCILGRRHTYNIKPTSILPVIRGGI